MNPVVILIIVAIVAGGIYLYSSSSPSPTPVPTTPMPTTPMPTTLPPPVNCEVSDWTKGACSAPCGGGTEIQTRTVTVQSQNGGQECPPLTQTQPCNQQACPPVDCQVSDWTTGVCSAPCGGGTQIQTRTVTVKPQYGGKECPPLAQTQPCNQQLCPACSYLDWVGCDCLTGTQTRSLDPASPSYCIPGPTSQSCKPPADCNWYGFDNSYISDGEYTSRNYTPDFATCYRGCEKDPNCAAVYAYDGREMPRNNDTNGPWVECSYIPQGNVPLLYQRYGSMTNYNPGNRHVFVNQKAAGNNFNPSIGKRV